MSAPDQGYEGALAGLRGTLNAVPTAIVVTAGDGCIQFANQQAHALFGYAERELDGAPLDWLVPFDVRDRHRAMHSQYFAHPSGTEMGRMRDLYGLRKDGERIAVEIFLAPLTLGDRQLTVAGISDLRERRRLEAAVESAALHEQRRLGAELHDSLGQQLTTIGLLLSSIAAKAGAACPSMAEELLGVSSLAREALQSTRRLAHDMTPRGPDGDGLGGALARLATSQAQVSGVMVHFDARGVDDAKLPRSVAHQLFRIAQEATANAIKHAAATEVKIELAVSPSQARLAVTDDGRGFQPSPDGAGIGLQTMKYRAGLIGARLSIDRPASGGTRVSCVRPHSTAAVAASGA